MKPQSWKIEGWKTTQWHSVEKNRTNCTCSWRQNDKLEGRKDRLGKTQALSDHSVQLYTKTFICFYEVNYFLGNRNDSKKALIQTNNIWKILSKNYFQKGPRPRGFYMKISMSFNLFQSIANHFIKLPQLWYLSLT